MINHNNRPSVALLFPLITASVVLPVLVAHKKMKVLAASLIQEGAISVSGANYLAFKLKKNNVDVAAAVDTQAGLAARTKKDLLLGAAGYITLEVGDYLSLDIAETGTFVESTAMLLELDTEIVGN